MRMNVYLATLGCPKNEVDSAGMAAVLERAGHLLVELPEDADVLVVNTCGFIAPAREESLGLLRELALGKRPDQHLIAAGCMAGLYGDMLRAVPGVDALLETQRWADIAGLVSRLRGAAVEAAPAGQPPAVDVLAADVYRGDEARDLLSPIEVPGGCPLPRESRAGAAATGR